MNVTEANAVNKVVRAMLELRDQPLIRTNGICGDSLCQALIDLADRAHRALGAGVTGEQVRASWPKPAGWTLKSGRSSLSTADTRTVTTISLERPA